MKALIRKEGETVTEDMGIPGIDWATGYPLTAPGWTGGPYILVNDYIPEDPADDFVTTDDGATYDRADPSAKETVNPGVPVPAGDTIVIDGVTYTRAL